MKRLFFTWICLLTVVWAPLGARPNALPEKTPFSLRLMSYNIRNGRGMDDMTDISRIGDVILAASADVVALQEVDSMTVRSGGVDVLEALGRQTLMHITYGPAIDFQGGKYGVGILSKEKPVRTRYIPLPGREEQRVLLIAEFEKFVFCSTHFSLTQEDRQLSVALVRQVLSSYNKPVFLAGDMNSTFQSEEQQALSSDFATINSPKINTFPASNATQCIDYIYQMKGADNLMASVLARRVMSDASVESDHLPVVVDVRLQVPAEAIFRTQPFLQNPTNNGMTVTWLTNVPVHSWVEYGTHSGQLDRRQELLVDGQVICNNFLHKIRLENLTPGATYYYRVCSREMLLYEAYKKEFGATAYSQEYSFTMPSDQTDDFSAIVLNDLHKQKATLAHLEQYIQKVSYDLVFFNGDCLDDPANEAQAVDFLTQMIQAVHAERVPIIILRGNHEIRNAYSIEMRAIFDYPGNKTYSAFNWGDTRFVLLDCGEDKPDSTAVYYNLNDFTQLRNQQADFLQQEVNGKEFKKAQCRILIHHIPIYGFKKKAFNPCLQAWGAVLEKAPFDLSVNAHMHQYAWHPAHKVGNPFPVVVGGGNRPENATLLLLNKRGESLTLQVFGVENTTINL